MKLKTFLLVVISTTLLTLNSCTSEWESSVDGIVAWSNTYTCLATATNYREYEKDQLRLGSFDFGKSRSLYYDIAIYEESGDLRRSLGLTNSPSSQNASCEIIYFMESANYILVRDAHSSSGLYR